MNTRISLFIRRNTYLCFVMLALLTVSVPGCRVTLIANYDETIDNGITELQKDVTTFFVKMERNLQPKTDKADYANHTDFYDKAKVDISTLRIRAATQPKNKIVEQQLELLSQNLDNIEKLHKIGFTTVEELQPIKGAMESSFKAMIQLQSALKREG